MGATQLRIAYFLDWKFDPRLGVPSKVRMQILTWQELGHQVVLYAVIPKKYEKQWLENFPGVNIYCYSSIFGRYNSRGKSVKAIWERQFSFVYMRFGILTPSQLRLIRKTPTVLELNTLNRQEAKHRGIFLKILNFYSEKIGLSACLCACAVTNEIANTFEKENPKLVVGTFPNSIRLSEIPVLESVNNFRPQMVFVGSPNLTWHGVDKLIKIAENHLNFDFHIVGATDLILNNKNIFTHSSIYGEDLYSFLTGMDVAFSSLALERNKINQGSPLKTRLYLACGLPVISSYQDSGLSFELESFLNLGIDFDKNMELTNAKISKFVKEWKGIRVNRSSISSIDSLKVEKLRLNFIKNSLTLRAYD